MLEDARDTCWCPKTKKYRFSYISIHCERLWLISLAAIRTAPARLTFPTSCETLPFSSWFSGWSSSSRVVCSFLRLMIKCHERFSRYSSFSLCRFESYSRNLARLVCLWENRVKVNFFSEPTSINIHRSILFQILLYSTSETSETARQIGSSIKKIDHRLFFHFNTSAIEFSSSLLIIMNEIQKKKPEPNEIHCSEH